MNILFILVEPALPENIGAVARAMCDIIAYIPLKQKYSSLNLSHALMFYAYTLSPFPSSKGKRPKKTPVGKYQKMIELAIVTMQSIITDLP